MSDLLEQASSDEGDELIEEGATPERKRPQSKQGPKQGPKQAPQAKPEKGVSARAQGRLELPLPDGATDAPTPRPFSLRPYQQRLVDAAVEALDAGEKPGLVLPTGGGKTAVMAGLVERLRARSPERPVLILQDRSALAVQNGPKIGEWLSLRHGQIGAGVEDWDGDVIMAMRQSAARTERLARIAKTDWAGVLIDEAHRLGSGEYEAIVGALPADAPVIGLSATLARADGRALAPLSSVIHGPTVERLIQMRFLTPFRFLVPQDAVQGHIRNGVASLRTVAGEFAANDAATLLNTEEINSAVVTRTRERFLEDPERAGQGLVAFCATIDHAEDLVAAYQGAGVDARAYHSRMPQSERDATLQAFDRGEFRVLANPLALGEGFDCARVGAVVILRPCAHRSTFVQIVGRGLRVAHPEEYPGVDKRDCIIFDYAAAVMRHRSLHCTASIFAREDDREGALDFEPQLKTCPSCDSALPASTRLCPECAHLFTGREPSVDAMDAHALVRVALETDGAGDHDWWRAGPGLYITHEGGALALMSDLRDGTYLVMGFIGRDGERRSRIVPVARCVGADAARSAAQDFVRDQADAAPRLSAIGERLAVRLAGFDAPDHDAAAAVAGARRAARLIRRRYGDGAGFEVDAAAYETIVRASPDDAAGHADDLVEAA